MNLFKYSTYVFDCDGVLLDSNKIKSEAFYDTALPYGRDEAQRFLTYHKANGGISRFEKFRYFFENIIQQISNVTDIDLALERYGDIVKERLLTCNETVGVKEFLYSIPETARKIVVSGGMQTELREVFARRNLDIMFDGVYGSPDTKQAILSRERDNGLLVYPVVYFGDSRLDYEVANEFDMDFVFISEFTEFADWRDFFKNKDVVVVNNFGELITR